MATVTLHAARTQLSQLIARAEAGEEIVLTRGNRPIAKFVAFAPAPAKRRFGALREILTVGPESSEPLPPDEIAQWE